MKWVLLTLVILFLGGCSQSPQTSFTLPSSLLEVEPIEYNRQISSNYEAGIFMLDIYEAYERCVLNLSAIKALIKGKESE